MEIPFFHVDAFTDKIFAGNPAGVCPLDNWLDDTILLNIASENNLAETAFFVKTGEDFHLRWFTPEIEMDLCGHATLATAHVIFNYSGYSSDKIIFHSQSGDLTVSRNQHQLTLNFPARMPVKADLPDVILQGIGVKPEEVYLSRDYVLVYKTEEEIRHIKPNQAILNTINLDPGGIIVTAKGKTVDFVSRFFTPQASIFEDPVTGSAHCSLVPFWAERLEKKQLKALQLSKRQGELTCEYLGNRVLIGGECITYSEGKIII
ncbi:MAG: PhzF family phenazine biosynthesis protein [Verrucomicrobia bacterium]|nr:PhzF family phenazine biosynthesis protein [Cytophagales bacterium]